MPEIGDTVIWRDENEEHSGLIRPAIRVDAEFPYVHKNLLWRACAAFVYRCVMKPFAFLFCKLRYRHSVKNRRVLRGMRRSGCFVYGNHTLMAGDAFIPNLVLSPKRTYVVVNPENLSAPGTRNFLQMNGAIPTPTALSGYRPFLEALEKRTVQRAAVVIYPEAHIWPYYTGIRPFSAMSFAYPVRFDEPVFCFTNTFHRRRLTTLPRVTTYVDGPFYPDRSLPPREQAQDLRDRVYAAMCRRAALSDYAPITYRKEDNP